MRWDEAKKQRIRQQISKKLVPFMKDVIVLRKGENVFNEKQEDLYVCTLKGYYHKGSNYIVNVVGEAANVNKNYNDRFLLIVDENSKQIQEHDYFILDEVKYEIVDKGNVEDIIFDSFLKRME